MSQRKAIEISGIVQGVGFRPFIYRLATENHLTGFITNTAAGVSIEVEGAAEAIDAFLSRLPKEVPPLARITQIDVADRAPNNDTEFRILPSRAGNQRRVLIAPDVAICGDCLAELLDPADRRFRYPFINCTNCGPRYTIVRDIPYDRAKTSMAVFPMCPECQREYDDPRNRRFHAQPNACWNCGPRVELWNNAGERMVVDDPIRKTVELLASGDIVAIKGLGGFHLAVDAFNESAVARLRERKRRVEKPFAIMAAGIAGLEELCKLDDVSRALLQSPAHPIVLAKKKRPERLAASVAPFNRDLGVFLPYTPLHHLLFTGKGNGALNGSSLCPPCPKNFPPEITEPLSDLCVKSFPGKEETEKTGFARDIKTTRGAVRGLTALVMTSGNLSEEPIAIDNAEALERLRGLADYFLVHNREILLRADDSVVRVAGGRGRLVRRSRGYVPAPVFLKEELPPVLAVGGELKNTICLTRGREAFLSQHIGDLENLESYKFFASTVAKFQRILEIEPKIIAYDLHPDYFSTRWALEREGVELEGIQHHHAHIASCMAENHLDGRVIGFALDGTGYGTDGKIWGGEVLVGDYHGFERFAHLDYIPMPGGAAAIAEPRRMAISYLFQHFGRHFWDLNIPFVRGLDRRRTENLLRVIERGLNCPLTSSTGRLFDAVAALTGVRENINYEAQGAIELEAAMELTIDDGRLSIPSTRSASEEDSPPVSPFPVHHSPGVKGAAPPHPTRGALGNSPPDSGGVAPAAPGWLPAGRAEGWSTNKNAGTPHSQLGATTNGALPQMSDDANYRFAIREDGSGWIIDSRPMFLELAQDLREGVPTGIVSYRFHSGFVEALTRVAELVRVRTGLDRVCLSGGSFQNCFLFEHLQERLKAARFHVFTHSEVPCGDGGISLGQAIIAAHRRG